MAVPEEFVGAWRRVGLLIDGVRRVDYCDVLWLQTADWFVDIRTLIVPGLAPEAGDVQAHFTQELSFAGTTDFNGAKLRWRHLLDSREEAPPDENLVVWQDKLLVESGHFPWQGREVPFVEEWGFLGREGVTGVGEDGHVRVEAAGFANEAQRTGPDFKAVKYLYSGGGWTQVGQVSTTAGVASRP